MKRLLSCVLLLCALSLPALAGVIHQGGEPEPESWMESDCNVWQWEF
jgi:hypothetical protein